MVCIFPKDESTDFLLPLYNCICTLGFRGVRVDTNEELKSVVEAISKAHFIVFLGHGTSFSLMGTPVNGEKTSIIDRSNVDLLKGKKLFLLSCRSAEFCESFQLSPSIGFGMMPTGLDDVYSMIDEDADFPALRQPDIDVYNECLISALSTAFRISNINDIEELCNKVRLCVNYEIAHCLIERKAAMFREVADLLQDLKNDCRFLK